jgi:uncharacterized protein YbdZ (MbtH family)
LVSHTKGGTYDECVQEYVAEEDIWPKREKVIAGWRKSHNDWLQNF